LCRFLLIYNWLCKLECVWRRLRIAFVSRAKHVCIQHLIERIELRFFTNLRKFSKQSTKTNLLIVRHHFQHHMCNELMKQCSVEGIMPRRTSTFLKCIVALFPANSLQYSPQHIAALNHSVNQTVRRKLQQRCPVHIDHKRNTLKK
jgi:hypothetical protein